MLRVQSQRAFERIPPGVGMRWRSYQT